MPKQDDHLVPILTRVTKKQIRTLDRLAKRHRVSRAEVLRRSIMVTTGEQAELFPPEG